MYKELLRKSEQKELGVTKKLVDLFHFSRLVYCNYATWQDIRLKYLISFGFGFGFGEEHLIFFVCLFSKKIFCYNPFVMGLYTIIISFKKGRLKKRTKQKTLPANASSISLAPKKEPPSGKVQSKFNKFCTLSFLTMKSQRLSNFFAFCLEEGKRQIFMFSLSVFLSHKKPPKLCGQKLEVSSRQLLT